MSEPMKVKAIRIKDHEQICAEPFIDEDNGQPMVSIMYGEGGAWWPGFVVHQLDFDIMFEYVEEETSDE